MTEAERLEHIENNFDLGLFDAFLWLDREAEKANHFIVNQLTNEGKISPLLLE